MTTELKRLKIVMEKVILPLNRLYPSNTDAKKRPLHFRNDLLKSLQAFQSGHHKLIEFFFSLEVVSHIKLLKLIFLLKTLPAAQPL